MDDGRKDDTGKPRTELLPPHALLEVSRVLSFGAEKYGPENWRRVEGLRERYTGAALRHLLANMAQEEYDPESELRTLAHAACCILFVLEDEILNADGVEVVHLSGESQAASDEG